MGRYIDWSDVTNRYGELATKVDATRAGSSYIPYAEAELDARLSTRYSTPFSSNNLTAKDLAIDLTYVKAYEFKDGKRTDGLRKRLDQTISDLLNGKMQMLTTSGDIVAQVGDTVYSNTMNFKPAFDVGPAERWDVDSDYVAVQDNARA